ncbi:50S ribosomal protein L10 [Candidatus Arthromitus sp. SFB-rat-Yit]|uniref:50S ribosomal protein L10 n=1 Tax=Candidatus Arthromitus sp. SFB-rat-Yit TaxID=1041504 RepID=UPI0002E2A8E0
MTKNMLNKVKKVTEIKEKFQDATAIILSNYQGINVEQDTELRKRMRDLGLEYKVYKNRLIKIVAKELGYDFLIEHLEGATSIAFSYKDIVSPAKILNEFSERLNSFHLKAGIIEGEYYDKDKLQKLANIPTKEVLISKLLSSIKSPIADFAYLISAIKDKKESEN